jgi:hypothetical protein
MRLLVCAAMLFSFGWLVAGCGSSDAQANEQTPADDGKPPDPKAYSKMINENPNISPEAKKVLLGASAGK